MNDYIRPYVPGSVTPKGFVVICVPGMKPVEVTDALASKLTKMIVGREIDRAQTLLRWFGGEPDA